MNLKMHRTINWPVAKASLRSIRLFGVASGLFALVTFRNDGGAAEATAQAESATTPASTIVQRGSNLRSIARTAYGHEVFSGFLAKLNHLANPDHVAAGASLRTPPLPEAFRDAGLDTRYQPAVDALAKAWTDLRSVLPEYTEACNSSGMQSGQTFPISAELQSKLVACADLVQSAIPVLSHPAYGQKPPTKAVGRLTGISLFLRKLSTGAIGSRDYDTEELCQCFGFAFIDTFVWMQECHP